MLEKWNVESVVYPEQPLCYMVSRVDDGESSTVILENASRAQAERLASLLNRTKASVFTYRDGGEV